MCPDWESNCQPFALRDDVQPTDPHRSMLEKYFKYPFGVNETCGQRCQQKPRIGEQGNLVEAVPRRRESGERGAEGAGRGGVRSQQGRRAGSSGELPGGRSVSLHCSGG